MKIEKIKNNDVKLTFMKNCNCQLNNGPLTLKSLLQQTTALEMFLYICNTKQEKESNINNNDAAEQKW